jgi:hypothetical protein
MADYQGVLAVLRAELAGVNQRRAELETAISTIEGLAPVGRVVIASSFVGPPTYEGLNMRQAVSKCISSMGGQPMTTAQITSALKAGGMRASEKSYRAQVYNTLHIMSKDGGPIQKDADGRWRMR